MSPILLLCLSVSGAPGHSDREERRDERVVAAQKTFDEYVKLGNAFDAKLADLYADDAKITNLRKYPDGHTRKTTLTGKQYKQIMRLAMPLAKERGDKSRFSDVKYEAKDNAVRITASRYSELKKYSSPMEWLLRPNENGSWLIVEEMSESRP